MHAPPMILVPRQTKSRRILAPQDLVFRLAALAVLSIELFWFPIYYFTTYEGNPDDRSGGALVFAVLFCPLSWLFAAIWYPQIWCHDTNVRFQLAFRIVCTILVAVVLSTLVAFGYGIVRFIVGIAQEM